MEADLIKERNAKAEKQVEYDLLLTRIAELESERNDAQKLISSLDVLLQKIKQTLFFKPVKSLLQLSWSGTIIGVLFLRQVQTNNNASHLLL
jgi:hypothetical protein